MGPAVRFSGQDVGVDPEILAIQERLRTDTVFWAEHCATIVAADKRPVRLKARPWQLAFDEALERQRLAGLPQRAIILKARKLGFSTWVQAKFMQRVSQRPFQVALTVAHRQDAAATLYDMASVMYQRLPGDVELGELIYGEPRAAPFSVKPQLVNVGESRSGARWMVLGDKQRKAEASIYQTMTAGAKGGARSSTPSAIHASEVAHIEDPDFLIGLFNSLPLIPDTIGVQESTAHGFNHFYDAWKKAVAGEETDSGLWAPLFFGWQDNPFNRFPFASDQARDRFAKTIGDKAGNGDDDEPWLVEQFGVSLEQLHWRRIVRDGPECKYGDVEMFHQEHPATPEQAFIGSGRPVFPGILVARMIRAAQEAPAPVEGVLRGVDFRERRTRQGTVLVPQGAEWVPVDQIEREDEETWPLGDRLLVWEHPVNEATQEGVPTTEVKPDGQYIVFGDVAEGRGVASDDPDYNVVQVLDHFTRKQVARYRSHIAIHDFPLILLLVALYYNEATLAPEKTGIGIGVVDALQKDYRYRRMYRTRRAGDSQRNDPMESLVGWKTTPVTKPLLELTFGIVLKTGEHGVRDVQTAREATTYVEDPKNRAKHGAQPGAHDDLLLGIMGAHRVAAELQPRRPGKGSGRMGGSGVVDPLTGW